MGHPMKKQMAQLHELQNDRLQVTYEQWKEKAPFGCSNGSSSH